MPGYYGRKRAEYIKSNGKSQSDIVLGKVLKCIPRYKNAGYNHFSYSGCKDVEVALEVVEKLKARGYGAHYSWGHPFCDKNISVWWR